MSGDDGCHNQSEEGEGKNSALDTTAAVTATTAGATVTVGTPQRDAGAGNAPRLEDGADMKGFPWA